MEKTTPLSQAEGLNALGSGTKYVYDSPTAALLERFPNPMSRDGTHRDCEVTIRAPEFTSLCPKTGQPDFAVIKVSYVPGEWCVESKSFKLYLGSYRMFGDFHEACVERIAQDLLKLLEPYSLEVIGEFTPRGGISFWPRTVYNREGFSCSHD